MSDRKFTAPAVCRPGARYERARSVVAPGTQRGFRRLSFAYTPNSSSNGSGALSSTRSTEGRRNHGHPFGPAKVTSDLISFSLSKRKVAS